MPPSRLICALALAALPIAAQGSVLYKSVDANGVVMFSDMPPPAGARLLEQRDIARPAEPAPSAPWGSSTDQPAPVEPLLDSDAVLAKANAKLDEAERALAEARRARGPINGAVRLTSTRQSLVDDAHIEEQKKNVKIARQRLMEILRERRQMLASSVRN